nr:hypothetical protein [Tanacetum cinerariifolium]
PSTYHSLLPSGTPPLLPIPLPVPSTSRRAKIPEADMPPRRRLLLTAPKPGCEVGESYAAAAARQPGPTMARSVDCSFVDTMGTRFRDTERWRMTALDMVNMRVSYQRERLAYEQESIQNHKALAKFEAYSRTLKARVTVLETQARRHEWKHQTADDFVVQHIMRTEDLEAGARIDTLEDIGEQQTRKQPNTTSVTNAQLQTMIDQGVTAALTARDALKSTNGDDSHNSRTGARRTERATHECFEASIKIPLPFSLTLGVSARVSECNSSSGSLITTPFLLLVETTGAAVMVRVLGLAAGIGVLAAAT